MGHADVNHCFAGFGVIFIILAQPPGASQPAKRAFHDPAFRQYLKAHRAGRPFDQFDRESQRIADERGQAATPLEPVVDLFGGGC